MTIAIDSSWRVTASREVELPLRAGAVWGQLRDWRHFLTIDPLHARVLPREWPSQAGPSGRDIIIQHRFLGLGVDRVGRLLRWREGRGFAVSDLSKRGLRTGFPHICMFELVTGTEHTCRLRITARGRWTATFVPRPLVKLWLDWVMRSTEARLRSHFAAMSRALRRTRLDRVRDSPP